MVVLLSGQLICATADEAERVRAHLPEHIRLTRAEPGCEVFEVTPLSDLIWRVEERFTDRTAFAAHQARAAAAVWGVATAGIARKYTVTDL